MYQYLLLILLLLISCKKDQHQSDSTTPIPNNPTNPADTTTIIFLNDSVKLTYFNQQYFLDLNGDNIRDLLFLWRWFPNNGINDYNDWVVKLNSATEIHAIADVQMLCRDTFHYNNNYYISVTSCSGGANLYRTDSFTYTPNLNINNVAATTFNSSNSDTVLMHRHYSHMPMPFGYVYQQEWQRGFYTTGSSGYLLFKINGKRIILFVRKMNHHIYFDFLKKIDL